MMNRLLKLNKNSIRNFSQSNQNLKAYSCRNELKESKKIVVKLGSAVITREDECGIALGRLASIVEQISQLHIKGKQMLMVTSGAVAFGKQKLRHELMMSRSMREAFTSKRLEQLKATSIDARACAASGQSGLMNLYGDLFSQYGITTAQVLVTKQDFENEFTRMNLQATLNELLELNIVPILNTNDAIAPPPQQNLDFEGIISIKDNDSLAARLAVMIDSDLLVIMSDVDGLFNNPPTQPHSRLLYSFSPKIDHTNVNFGDKSKVGTGGMQSKVNSATWALENNCSVVICNGQKENAISDIIQGKQIGTFFTNSLETRENNVEKMAINARQGSIKLTNLTSQERSSIILTYAHKLLDEADLILEANKLDLELAYKNNLNSSLLSRLSMNEHKLKTLSDGLIQIANNTNILNRVIKLVKVSNDLILRQITVPIGVLCVIFESRPDSLPQICALSICSGNGLLLKGGTEAKNTNRVLHRLVQDSLESYAPRDTISLLNSRDEINDLLELDNKFIDLIIPRGSNELVRHIQKHSRHVPVLGHSDGVCHIYVDRDADLKITLKIIKDAKCGYPAACNAVETLLINKDILKTPVFDSLIQMLEKEKVKIYSGPRLNETITFAPPLAKSLNHEYSDLAVTIELVNDTQDAIEHINKYGSHHTDCIITQNNQIAEQFLRNVDSACVFHNASTRMADGYRFGLGAEVGISTGRLHARGPVGVEGLLTTKWLLVGTGDTAEDFLNGNKKFLHENLDFNSNYKINTFTQTFTDLN